MVNPAARPAVSDLTAIQGRFKLNNTSMFSKASANSKYPRSPSAAIVHTDAGSAGKSHFTSTATTAAVGRNTPTTSASIQRWWRPSARPNWLRSLMYGARDSVLIHLVKRMLAYSTPADAKRNVSSAMSMPSL